MIEIMIEILKEKLTEIHHYILNHLKIRLLRIYL